MATLHRISLVLHFVIIQIVAESSDLSDTELTFINGYNEDPRTDKPDIVMDEAWLTINNSESFDIDVFALNHQCWKCPMVRVESVGGSDVKTLVVNTTFSTDMEVRHGTSGGETTAMCRFDIKFRENGDYWLFFHNGTDGCIPKISNDPMPAEMPILYTAVGIAGLCIVVKLAFCIYRRKREGSPILSVGGKTTSLELKPNESADQMDVYKTTHNKKARLKSLDTLRGLSLVIMIFVNYGGGGYWFFDHLPWNGLTVADLVFPWFVFMMGSSMNYSFKSMFKRRKSRLAILGKVVKRGALLFAFGIILNTNWGPVKLTHLRVPGVLQRLSLSYLVVALTETAFTRKDWNTPSTWIVSFLMLGVYLGLTLGFMYQDVPRLVGHPGNLYYNARKCGYIGPGGLHEDGQYVNCTGGAAGYIDRLVLGDDHIYGNPTPKKIYQTVQPFDPEGILGTLTSVFLCFLGLQGAIGAGLCNFSVNDGIIPVNKNLWSVSFVLVTGSFAFVFLCILYIGIDIFHLWDGDPFIFTGMNPLAIFLCHDIFYRFFPVNFVVDPVHWQLLLKAVWDVVIWVTLGYVLYVKQIFIAL